MRHLQTCPVASVATPDRFAHKGRRHPVRALGDPTLGHGGCQQARSASHALRITSVRWGRWNRSNAGLAAMRHILAVGRARAVLAGATRAAGVKGQSSSSPHRPRPRNHHHTHLPPRHHRLQFLWSLPYGLPYYPPQHPARRRSRHYPCPLLGLRSLLIC